MSNKKLLFFLISTVLTVWLATPFVVSLMHSDMANRGQFGDIYGSVNALFSGFAFAGLFYTINLQIKQLRLQQAELKIQRNELRLQREEMAASRGELRLQVEMQRSLLIATIAQVDVATCNAQIEAIKMDSFSVNDSGKYRFVPIIDEQVSLLKNLSKELKSVIPTVR